MELAKSQKEGFSKAKGHSLLVLGQSGTGKSALIEIIAKHLQKIRKQVALTATTGIASLNIGGQTIHRWSGIGDGGTPLIKFIKNYSLMISTSPSSSHSLKLTLIIDEISMFSLKLFETLEYICRKLRNTNFYFGSLQVMCAGDCIQLPPVPHYLKLDNGEYRFKSPHFTKFFRHKIVLKDVVRQSEINFIECINNVSRGELPQDSLNLLKRLSRTLSSGPMPIRLSAKKCDCDVYNASKLVEIEGNAESFRAQDSGEKKYLKSLAVPEDLHLKIDCPVLLLRNLSDTLVNGLRGKVRKLSKDLISVYFDTSKKKFN